MVAVLPASGVELGEDKSIAQSLRIECKERMDRGAAPNGGFETPPRRAVRQTFEGCTTPPRTRSPRSPCTPPSKDRGPIFGFKDLRHSKTTPPMMCKAPRSALHRAIEKGDVDLLREALAEDPEAATLPLFELWEPPLCVAARFAGPAAVLQELIEHGADVNATDLYGHSPLHILTNKKKQAESAFAGSFALPGLSDPQDANEFQDERRAKINGLQESVEVLMQAGAE
eukprot:CAMPEP_0178469054 /NCGR_PEP_ID=MMETSP0689_2-20121128/53231_1 /TAXON_ID=160604 /ORGANISM="Amphidinium massartii, Strain CS-259" /LENGTH=227 /DNA_ID=CAMNT_0020096117 /DNA_START=73 /DNA_END=757 /DNA_ORIENTATION=+